MFGGVIDISHYESSMNLATAKSEGIVAVIHKATEGASGVDSTYATQYAQAQSLGLLWGAYHFGTAADVGQQLANFNSVVGTLEPGTLVALDFEPNTDTANDTMSLSQAEQFVTAFQEQYGFLPLIYGSNLLQEIPSSSILASCKLWVADYTTASQPTLPPAYSAWTLWQYTESATVAGITCDQNRFEGTELALRRGWPFRT